MEQKEKNPNIRENPNNFCKIDLIIPSKREYKYYLNELSNIFVYTNKTKANKRVSA